MSSQSVPTNRFADRHIGLEASDEAENAGHSWL